MKKKLTDLNITPIRPSIAKAEVMLKIWNDADSVEVDPPVDEHPFSFEFKTFVEGVNLQELAERPKQKLKEQIDGYIKEYSTEQDKINQITPYVTQVISDIEKG